MRFWYPREAGAPSGLNCGPAPGKLCQGAATGLCLSTIETLFVGKPGGDPENCMLYKVSSEATISSGVWNMH